MFIYCQPDVENGNNVLIHHFGKLHIDHSSAQQLRPPLEISDYSLARLLVVSASPYTYLSSLRLPCSQRNFHPLLVEVCQH